MDHAHQRLHGVAEGHARGELVEQVLGELELLQRGDVAGHVAPGPARLEGSARVVVAGDELQLAGVVQGRERVARLGDELVGRAGGDARVLEEGLVEGGAQPVGGLDHHRRAGVGLQQQPEVIPPGVVDGPVRSLGSAADLQPQGRAEDHVVGGIGLQVDQQGQVAVARSAMRDVQRCSSRSRRGGDALLLHEGAGAEAQHRALGVDGVVARGGRHHRERGGDVAHGVEVFERTEEPGGGRGGVGEEPEVPVAGVGGAALQGDLAVVEVAARAARGLHPDVHRVGVVGSRGDQRTHPRRRSLEEHPGVVPHQRDHELLSELLQRQSREGIVDEGKDPVAVGGDEEAVGDPLRAEPVGEAVGVEEELDEVRAADSVLAGVLHVEHAEREPGAALVGGEHPEAPVGEHLAGDGVVGRGGDQEHVGAEVLVGEGDGHRAVGGGVHEEAVEALREGGLVLQQDQRPGGGVGVERGEERRPSLRAAPRLPDRARRGRPAAGAARGRCAVLRRGRGGRPRGARSRARPARGRASRRSASVRSQRRRRSHSVST